jgi:ClpP class serine protease
LEASRKRLLARIENERQSRVILLVHRQETMSLLGFPLFRYIDVNDSEEVIRAIEEPALGKSRKNCYGVFVSERLLAAQFG